MTILMSRSPGLPEHGGAPSQVRRLAGDEVEIRRQLFLLAVGFAVTFALFLALPFMQVVSSPMPPGTIIIDPPALPMPAKFDPPTPPITPEKPADEVPVMTPDKPFIPFDLLFTKVTPDGLDIPMRTITWDPGEVLPEIFNPDQLDRQPNPIHKVAPDVPRGIRNPGQVVLEFIVTPQGSVANIKVISSTDTAFERAAVIALARWKFEPGVKNNSPVSTRMRLPMRFSVAN
jgi:protein TonB